MKNIIFLLLAVFTITRAVAFEDPLYLSNSLVNIQHAKVDDSSNHFFNALHNLKLAVELTHSIHDESVRKCVCNHLYAHMKYLESQYPSRNFANMCEETLMLYENSDEILAECEDNIREKIPSHIRAMLVLLQLAEKSESENKIAKASRL